MGIIHTDHLVCEYKKHDENGDEIGVMRAVDDISIDVKKGDFVAILGHNGSGKSTMAKHINALLRPAGGTITVCGMDTQDEDKLWDIRKSAGMVFQNPDNQIVATVVEEDVGFGPENLGIPPKEIWWRVEESLKAVGMYAYRKHSPNKLSGGQKQRVAIAGIMAMRPECIIMDEPTAMLDPNGRREVMETMHELNRTEGITVLLITHYMNEVTDADRVIVMDDGKIALQGTPKEVFSHVDEMKRLGLDVPQVTELADELRKTNIPMPEGILNIEEFTEAFSHIAGKKTIHAFTDALKSPETQNPVRTENSMKEPEKAPFEASCPLTEEILRLEDVSYTYSAGNAYEKQALKHVNITIRRGECIGLIGHTGSGKSTLIQMLNGLEKPTEGIVRYCGTDIRSEGFSLKELRSHVGMVFQYPDYQLFESTVLRDVCYGPKNLGLTKEEARERAEEALELTHVAKRLWEASPLELSGGQKRRVAIAGVLAMKPEVLILDEPTAGLDPKGRDEVLGEIARIQRETGMTIILVSHSMEDVARFTSRLIVMNQGEAVYQGTPREIFRKQAELEKIGLSVPQVTKLAKHLQEKGMPIGEDIITVQEAAEACRKYVQYAGKETGI